jgi:CysZ protein
VSAGGGAWREVGSAARSFALPAAALRLLLRERRLWPLAALPLLLSVAAVVGAAGAVLAWSGEIRAFAFGLFPVLGAETWYAWLWVGPLRALFFLLGVALCAALAALAVVAAFALASLVASPFHDALARRVEEIVTGRVEALEEPGLAGVLRQATRAVREEARRLGFFAALGLSLGAVSLLVPGGQLVAGPALVLVSLLFLPLDYAGYTFDRRGVPFAERRRWVRRHLGPALGFGAAALLLCAVPGLNLLALPVLVVAGTLLALRHPIRAGAPGARTATSP